MVTIIHGDDIVSSRNYFRDQKQKSTNRISFDGQFELEELIAAVQGRDLFVAENKIFIENFFSKNKLNASKTKEIIDYINKNEKTLNVFFWEERVLEKKHLILFSVPKVEAFMVPKFLFLFLDSIRPRNYKNSIKVFHKALQNIDPELIFFMLQRQFRLLLSVADKKSQNSIDEVLRLLSWQKAKLERQTRLFSVQKLLELHRALYKIELNHKTGNLPHSLDKEIDFFLLTV